MRYQIANEQSDTSIVFHAACSLWFIMICYLAFGAWSKFAHGVALMFHLGFAIFSRKACMAFVCVWYLSCIPFTDYIVQGHRNQSGLNSSSRALLRCARFQLPRRANSLVYSRVVIFYLRHIYIWCGFVLHNPGALMASQKYKRTTSRCGGQINW